MIQFLADQIDQMDLAIDQLAMRDRNLDRFAIMLIDNVVELTLHTHAENLSYTSYSYLNPDKRPYDQKLIRDALGQQFDRKVKLAKASEMVQSEICESINYLHSFRNTAYHSGRRHEGILHALAIFYFKNACTVLQKFRPFVWSYGDSDKVSLRAMKYLGKIEFMASQEGFGLAWKRMLEIAESMEDSLISDLHTDMSSTIEKTDKDINFLLENSTHHNEDRKTVLIEVQLWPAFHTAATDDFLERAGHTTLSDREKIDYLRANYNWPLKSDPIPSWRNRLQSLRNEKNPHRALKKYCDFHTQTEQIRMEIREAVFQLDSHIQNEIDYYRGK
ncbi:hypothetical protein C1882_01380 [Pseudomonas sp. FW305-E2]|uniref:hypothetical protein n=1 Tax=Pseudomonas sp. FW305-E2 TaxID=2075558 RepID=UPI000B4F4697|nr:MULTISPECIES: hypothetical protein [Pseudomonas]POA89255.1 hypothetical protein C1882_01380 [Pseudomonas sp. FW305-E2]